METKSTERPILQAAAGGGVGGFVMALVWIVATAQPENIYLLPCLPLILTIGAGIGFVGGLLIALTRALTETHPGVLVRMVVLMVFMGLFPALWLFANDFPQRCGIEDSDGFWFWYWEAAVVFNLSISVASGLTVSLWRLVFLGPELAWTTNRRLLFLPNLGLRLVSLFGLMESLLLIGYLAAPSVPVGWIATYPQTLLDPAWLTAVVLTGLYFLSTVYLSFTKPSELVFLGVWGLSNFPLLMWALTEVQRPNSKYLPAAIAAFVFIALGLALVADRLSSDEQITDEIKSVEVL